MGEWKRTLDVLPPEHLVVETKIDDGKFIRNEQWLYRKGNLWFIPDRGVHVYYMPTHWREIR